MTITFGTPRGPPGTGPELTSTMTSNWQLTQCRTVKASITICGLHMSCKQNDQGTYTGPLIDGRWEPRLHTSYKFDEAVRYIGMSLTFRDYPEDESIGRRRRYSAKWELQAFGVKLSSGNFPTRCPVPGFEFEAPEVYSMSKLAEMVHLRNRETNALNTRDITTLQFEITEHPDDHGQEPHGSPPAFMSVAAACAQLFNDAETADVCFCIHRPSKIQSSPKKIYAHSKLLSARLPYFAAMFQNSFSEGNLEPETATTADTAQCTDFEWNGDSDSDYEGDDEDKAENLPKTPPKLKPENTHLSENNTMKEADKKRKVVHVKDVAYRTYHALLLYLYTGSITFAPLQSNYREAKQRDMSFWMETQLSRSEYCAANATVLAPIEGFDLPWSSPKSIYKVADRLDVPDLVLAATKQIQKSLTKDNAAEEMMSSFSRTHSKIQELEVQYMRQNWDNIAQSRGFASVITDMVGHQATAEAWLSLMREKKPLARKGKTGK